MKNKSYQIIGWWLCIWVGIISCSDSGQLNEQSNVSVTNRSMPETLLDHRSRNNDAIGGKELYQKAHEIDTWLKAGNYTKVENFFQKEVSERTFTAGGGFYAEQLLGRLFGQSQIDGKFDPSWQTYLDRWVDASPKSSIAYIVRSHFYYEYAWHLRGNKTANQTAQNALEGFREKMLLSIADAEQALSLDPENPLTIMRILSIGQNTGMSREIFEAYFQKAIELVPYFAEAYSVKADYLLPQWYGSKEEALAFARESAQSAPQGSLLPMVLIMTHKNLCHSHPFGLWGYFKQNQVWQEVQASYERLISELPSSGYYAFKYGELARQTGREDIAQYNFNVAWARESDHPQIHKALSKLIR